MPSGAKKRKAAKKKKVNQTSDSSTTSASTLSLGEQDLKPIDEKESDGGSTASPSSQDHNVQHHPFTEQQDEEVEKREDPSSVRSIVTKNLQGSEAREGETAAHIDNKLKSQDFESKNVIVIEWGKESHDDGSSSRSSSSSSSDDEESRVLDKKIVAVETAPPVNSVNPVTQVIDSLAKETDSSIESYEVSLQKEEDVVITTSNENPASSSLDANGSEAAAKVDGEKSFPSIDDSKVGTSDGKEHVKYSETTDCSIEQPLLSSAPQAVQTTSWKGCCGLFELFSGSNR